MRSKTSYFNATVFRKHLSRLWPLAVMFTLVLFLGIFMPIFHETMNSGYGSLPGAAKLYADVQSDRMYMADGMLDSITDGWPIVLMLYSTSLAIFLFSYLMNARQAIGLHATPLRRETHFLSAMAAGFTCIAGPFVFIALLISIVTAWGGLFVPEILIWLLVSILEGLFFLCLAALCMQATGITFFGGILALIMNFIFPGLELVVSIMTSSFVYGYDGNLSGVTLPLSPCMKMVSGHDLIEYGYQQANTFIGWGYIAAMTAAGLLLAALALLLYRRRPLESAGDAIAHGFLKPIFKYAFSAGCAVVLGYIFYNLLFPRYDVIGWPYLTVCLMAGGAIGLLAAEMMLRKSLKVLGHAKKGMAIACAALLCCCLVLGLDILGLARRLPDADKIEMVQLSAGQNGYLQITDPQGIAAVRDANRQAAKEGPPPQDFWWLNIYIQYVMKDGSYVTRRYQLAEDTAQLNDPQSAASQITAILNNPDLILANLGDLSLVNSIELDTYGGSEVVSGQDMRQLLDAIVADIRAGTLGSFAFDFERESYDDSRYLTLYLNRQNSEYNRFYNIGSFDVPEDSAAVRTFLESKDYFGLSAPPLINSEKTPH